MVARFTRAQCPQGRASRSPFRVFPSEACVVDEQPPICQGQMPPLAQAMFLPSCGWRAPRTAPRLSTFMTARFAQGQTVDRTYEIVALLAERDAYEMYLA